MRAVASLLAAASVAAVAAAAAVDALRRAPPGVPRGVRGELVYSDAACHRHSLRLPDLARHDYLTVGCGVFMRRDNLGVRDGDVAWFAYPEPGGTTTLLRRRELPGGVTVQTVAWLGGKRFAAVLEPRGRVTVWQGSRQLRETASGVFMELRASPSGRYFGALGGGRIHVIARSGRGLWETRGRAIAWSPDESYAAVARASELVIVPAAGGDPVFRLDVRAHDVDWRTLERR